MNEKLVVLSVEELREVIRDVVREHAANENARTAEEWLTTEQLAQRLGVCTRQIAKLVRRDGLPQHTIGPRLHRYMWSEVQTWLRLDAPATTPARAPLHLAAKPPMQTSSRGSATNRRFVRRDGLGDLGK